MCWPPFVRHRRVKLNGYLNLTCSHCNSSLDVDLEHIQVYCPFCGNELSVKAGEFKSLYEKYNKIKLVESK